MTQKEKNHLISQYDGEIAYLDSEIGILLNKLKEQNLYDNTLIILTSDHGEYFGEHFLITHSKDIYEPVMRVPAIIKYPYSAERGARDEKKYVYLQK